MRAKNPLKLLLELLDVLAILLENLLKQVGQLIVALGGGGPSAPREVHP